MKNYFTEELIKKLSRRKFLQKLGVTTAGLALIPYLGTSEIFAFKHERKNAFLSKVAITKADNYDRSFIKQKVQYLFELIDGITDVVKSGNKVAIKINLTGGGGGSAAYNMWTHPEVLRAVGELVIDCGVNAQDIYIVESLWNDSSYNEYGYRDVQNSLGANLVNLNNPDPYVNFIQKEVGLTSFNFTSFTMNQILSDVDVYISIPKMKQHYEAGITCSLKNQVGAVPKQFYTIPSDQGSRAALHNKTGGSSKSHLPRSICDLYFARPVNLAVIDGIMNARGGEGTWNPTFQVSEDHVLLAGKDPVATDSVAAFFMGVNPEAEKIPLPNPTEGECDNYLYLLNQLGVGTNKMNEIEVVGDGAVLVVLPVELTIFSAKVVNDKVELNWETKTEKNNHGFEIEKYNNVWNKIGFVQGHGTTTKNSNYTFTDRNAFGSSFKYRLKQIDYNGSYTYSKIIDVNVNGVNKYELGQNFPNPFNPLTTIKFMIAHDHYVTLKVYNVEGKEIVTLVNGKISSGYHTVTWNAKAVPSGTYIYKISAGSFSESKKMILLR